MGRPSYVCAICSEHFTRKYSARRHNHNLHNGAAEIVRLIDYLAGRSSGQYTANNPFWFKRNNQLHNFGSATAADGLDDTFRPTYIPQQAPSEISQYSASPINRSLPTMNDASYRTGLTQDNIVKIQELKRLAYKYPHYCAIPDEAIKFAIYNSIIGDNTLLDQMLEQLRSVDAMNKY
jgi:hypothetical protein